MSSIELRGVTKRYDGNEPAVRDVDLTVADGELLVLVGPSGCGKTTLLRTVAGLETPDDGEVYIGGERVTDLPAREREVALMFQEYALFPNMTVAENVGFNLRMRGTDGVDARVAETAELLEITDLLDRAVETLSGGQKQRVALGRAIADDPEAFLLDEPLANLDANLREQTRTELARLQADLEITTVHVTHDQQEALTMGDRVAVMHEGSLLQVGPPEAVYRRPATLFVARFVGSPTMNCFSGSVGGEGVEIGRSGAVPLDVALAEDAGAEDHTDDDRTDDDRADDDRTDDDRAADDRTDDDHTDGAVVVGVRPEHVRVEPDDDADGPWAATVSLVQFEGADAFVHLDSDALGEVVARVRADSAPDRGTRARIDFDTSAIHVFDSETGARISTGDEKEIETRPTSGR